MSKYILSFLIAALLSFLLTPIIRRVSLKIGAVDIPDDRKIHRISMPQAGGLAIFFSFILSILLLINIGDYSHYLQFLINDPAWFWAFIGAVIIVCMGLIDDIRRLHYGFKILFQVISGLLLINSGFEITSLSFPFSSAPLRLGVLSIPFTILWIVGITNALNLVDGLDGLAAGIALIASGAIVAISILNGNVSIALLACILGGSILGFLKYNFHPASIFLGDSGSLFLGYCLSIISIEGSYKGATALSIVVPILALGLPIIDTVLSMLRRFLKSAGLVQSDEKQIMFLGMFKADRAHIHHRMMEMGLSHQNVVYLLYSFCILLGLVAVATMFLKDRDIAFLMVAIGIATYAGIRKLEYKELEVVKQGTLLPLYSLPIVNRRIFHVFYDMVFIALAYAGSFFILYEDASYEFVRHIVFQTFPLILVIKVTNFYLFGLYRRSWRYTNIADFLRLSQSILASFVVCVVIFNFSFVPAVSFRIFLIDCLLLLVMASATRASFRILEYVKKREQKEGETVVIYGAGRGGAFALREFLSNTNLKVLPVGFIDDEQTKVGKLINGYPVLGTIEDLPAIIDKQRPSQVIVSTLKIPLERIQAVKRFGQENNIRVKRFRITFEEL